MGTNENVDSYISDDSEKYFDAETSERFENPESDKMLFLHDKKTETNLEIKQRFNELGIDNVDLTGAKEIWQEKIEKSVETMYEKYPELKGFIGSIVTADLPEGVYACSGPKMTERGLISEIQLNRSKLEKGDLEWKLVDLERENFRGERYLAGNGLEGIMKHEMAHSLHLKLIADEFGEDRSAYTIEQLKEIQDRYNRNAIVIDMGCDTLKELEIRPRDMAKGLSSYGASDFGEFFAEAISEYETSRHPRPIAVRMHKKYEEYVREKRAVQVEDPSKQFEYSEQDEARVLTRLSAEQWKSGNQAIENTLEAMRDDLRDRGVEDGDTMEAMIAHERVRLQEELSSNIEGDLSNHYDGPVWRETKDSENVTKQNDSEINMKNRTEEEK